MDQFVAFLFIVFGLYLIGIAIASFVTRRMFGFGKMDRYTEASVRAAAPSLSIGYLVLGVTWIVSRLGSFVPALAALNDARIIILLVGIVAALPFVILSARKLVEKNK